MAKKRPETDVSDHRPVNSYLYTSRFEFNYHVNKFYPWINDTRMKRQIDSVIFSRR